MAKEKIVRCRVSKAEAGTRHESVRYIPLEIYGLWCTLMRERHSFDIDGDCASLWFDIDGDPHVEYDDADYEKVIRVALSIYSEQDGMFRKIVRYFPSGAYDEIKPRFLAHYAEYFEASRFAPKIEEKRGVWLKRET
jgi:hypothetical protein